MCCWELNLGPLEEQLVLTAEPSLQLLLLGSYVRIPQWLYVLNVTPNEKREGPILALLGWEGSKLSGYDSLPISTR